MATDHLSQFLPAVCAGFGLLAVGGVNLLLLRRSLRLRALATLVALGITLSAAAAIDQPGVMLATARLLAFALVPCLVLGFPRLVARTARLLAALHHASLRFGLLAIAGLSLVVISVLVFERADADIATLDTKQLEATRLRGPVVPSTRGKAVTDKGTLIVLHELVTPRSDSDLLTEEERLLHNARLDDQVIRRGKADGVSNCHGWVFAHGRFILGHDSVELILDENGYTETHEPEPGDVVVYGSRGAISHTGIVRYVTEGLPVIVESKWGALGVFIHPADRTPYGTQYSFYRSHRQGHLLAGLGDANTPKGPHRPLATE
jgi:hypothetical protein